MKILVACEESQVVTIAFRNRGHEAYSCDVQDCSGGHPEWHIKDDVLKIINDSWDMIIAFPPCTHLAVSGAAWFEEKKKDGRQWQGIDFFIKFTNLKCKKTCIENPVGIMSKYYCPPTQIIHPWQFGHPEQKKTCLWLKNISPLKPTKIVYKEMMKLPRAERERIHWLSGTQSKERSKTFPGIAEAMAEQWTREHKNYNGFNL